VQGVVLLGEGGHGKTRLAFALAQRLSETGDAVVLAAPGAGSSADEYLRACLEPVFESLRRAAGDSGSMLAKRLTEARRDSNGKPPVIWIVVPDFDRVESHEVRQTLDSFQVTSPSVRYLLTSRRRGWDGAFQGEGSDASRAWKPVSVGRLDAVEVGEWLLHRGLHVGSPVSAGILGVGNTAAIPDEASDLVLRLGLTHPLAFAALSGLIESADGSTLASDWLATRGTQVAIMQAVRESICTRASRNLRGLVPLDLIKIVFDNLSNQRDNLLLSPIRELPARYMDCLTEVPAAALIRQFEEVGVLASAGDRLGWAIAWFPKGGEPE
jgi:hypothetical protein